VRRDDLATFHVDGTLGSAVAGLTECWIQPRAATPKPVWNPDVPQTIDFFTTWQKVPANRNYDNAFKVEWELFIRHLYEDTEFPWDLFAGARGVQLAELGQQSWRERRTVDVPPLTEK
jgi:predicted dehydrogenase